MEQLDLSEITDRYEQERRGGPPYHPRMMVKVLLYRDCIGVASSRRIAWRLHEDIAFRVLAANNTPDFRKEHQEVLGLDSSLAQSFSEGSGIGGPGRIILVRKMC